MSYYIEQAVFLHHHPFSFSLSPGRCLIVPQLLQLQPLLQKGGLLLIASFLFLLLLFILTAQHQTFGDGSGVKDRMKDVVGEGSRACNFSCPTQRTAEWRGCSVDSGRTLFPQPRPPSFPGTQPTESQLSRGRLPQLRILGKCPAIVHFS